MKIVKCKRCGAQYSDTISSVCPICGNSETHKNNAAIILVLVIVGLVAVIVLGNALWGGDSENILAGSSDIASGSETEITSSREEDSDRQIYLDSNVKVDFIELTDGREFGMTADLKVCYIKLKVENVSNKRFTVMITDAYANDSAVNIMSGVPMTLAPGKNSQAPFVFGYNNIVESVEDIEKLEFKIMLYDTDSNETLLTSENIKLDF